MDAINQTALNRLKKHARELTRQQFNTLKGQILAGNDKGAMKGLDRLLAEKEGRA